MACLHACLIYIIPTHNSTFPISFPGPALQLSDPHVSVAWDETGNKYELPNFVRSDPSNMLQS